MAVARGEGEAGLVVFVAGDAVGGFVAEGEEVHADGEVAEGGGEVQGGVG